MEYQKPEEGYTFIKRYSRELTVIITENTEFVWIGVVIKDLLEAERHEETFEEDELADQEIDINIK